MADIYVIMIIILAVVQSICVLYFYSLYTKEKAKHEETVKYLSEGFKGVVKHCEDMASVYRKAKAQTQRAIFEEDKKLLDKIDKETLVYYYKKHSERPIKK